eukprot:COSAG02_NODE_1482_length_12387_cov_6.381348_11_plen_163_part_00
MVQSKQTDFAKGDATLRRLSVPVSVTVVTLTAARCGICSRVVCCEWVLVEACIGGNDQSGVDALPSVCHFCICTLFIVQPRGHRSEWKLPFVRQRAFKVGRSHSCTPISSNADVWPPSTTRDLNPYVVLKNLRTCTSSSAAACGFEIALPVLQNHTNIVASQ